MNQFILHYFFMVCICSKTVSGYSMEKSNQFDIDDFINQLLSSQKFDELADIVAEKAVKKIRNLETLEHASEKPIARHSAEVSHSVEAEATNHDNDSHEEQDKRKSVINADSKEGNESPPLRQEIRNEHNKLEDVDYQERERDEKPSKKVVKSTLNTEALMKKDDGSSPPKLSLKFKHLVKHVQNEKLRNRQDSHSNEHNPWKHLEYSKQKRSRPMPGIKNQDFKPVSSGRNVKYENVNTRYYDRRENSVNRELSDPRCKSKHATCNSRPQFKAEKLPRLPVIDIDENGKPKVKEEVKEEALQEQKNIKKKIMKHEEMPRKDEDDEFTWKARNSDSGKSEDEHGDSKEQFLRSSTSRSEPGEATTRRAIRREGDRYYTYLSGPEYEEFYEKLAKQLKKKSVPAI